ncbi:MAG: hypothetical protein LWW85_08020 [Marinilabiliales bacterium]|nr:hypothetical protein [Marinilabiliales bacterium]
MLYTNLKHLEKRAEYRQILADHAQVVIVCGRMDHDSIPLYRWAEAAARTFRHICFCDMEADNPESLVLMDLEEMKGEMIVPTVICLQEAKVLQIFRGVQETAALHRQLKYLYPKSNRIPKPLTKTDRTCKSL